MHQQPHFSRRRRKTSPGRAIHLAAGGGEGSGAPTAQWDAMFLACPYSDTNDVPEPFTKAARGLNTSSTDSVQWLLFAEGSKVKRISVDRSAIDFCADAAVNAEYRHTQIWHAEQSDGAWLMTTVGTQPG